MSTGKKIDWDAFSEEHKKILVEHVGNEQYARLLKPKVALDILLKYEGFIGYTDFILRIVDTCFQTKLR